MAESSSDISPFSDSVSSEYDELEGDAGQHQRIVDTTPRGGRGGVRGGRGRENTAPRPKNKDIRRQEGEKRGVKRHREKDPNEPKKKLTPYMIFLKENRAEVKQKLQREGSTASLNEVMKAVGVAWRKLPPELKVKYHRLSTADEERYTKELAAYVEKKKTHEASGKDSDNDEAEDGPPKKKYRKSSPVRRTIKQKRLKVRARGEDIFDRIVLTQYTVNKLKGKIQEKRQDYRNIAQIIQLPDVRIRDNQDVVVLEDDAELEFVYSDSNPTQTSALQKILSKTEIPPIPMDDDVLPNDLDDDF